MSLTSGVAKAVKSAREIIVPETDPQDADILETLKKEHREVQALLSQLQDATGAQRNALVQKIKLALVPHTKAEEKTVYDAVLALKNRQAQEHGHEGYLEHEWASKTLVRLGSFAPGSAEHKAAAKVLKELVDHHIKEEENSIWNDIEDNFSDEQRRAMNRAFLAAKKKVKLG